MNQQPAYTGPIHSDGFASYFAETAQHLARGLYQRATADNGERARQQIVNNANALIAYRAANGWS